MSEPLKRVLMEICVILALLLQAACNGGGSAANDSRQPEPSANAIVSKYGYQIVNIWPHDSNAFTQGLILADGKLLESTGQEGRSSLRSVDLESGRILKKVEVPLPYFAEGIAMLDGKIYQLTWQHQLGFIYNSQTLERIGEFKYAGEGWGLTTDGRSLIMSDGSSRLRFLDPASFKVTKTLSVLDGKVPVSNLNELEFVQGEIYANIWHDDRIAAIDPNTGRVTAWIDLTGLMPADEVEDPEAVLNGIAYDQANDRLFVTGKLWPRIYEIRIRK